MSRPPSQAVIEAVEQAESRHTYLMFGECSCGYLSLEYKGWRSHRRVEVARAAEAAALKVAADECEANARDWYGTDIFRDVDSADLAAVRSAMQAQNKRCDRHTWVSNCPECHGGHSSATGHDHEPQAKGKDIDNLSAWYFRRALTMRADILRRMADELTDTDDRSK
jgi:cytochrome c553